MYLYFGIFFILILLCLIVNHWRKACIIKKVCAMPPEDKCQLLNDMIRPFGYQYLPHKDIFFSTLDAWQRDYGYTRSYDCSAPYLNMVFDSEPIYFNYNNRTWLIELWKGQYGINTGAEIGFYCAEDIIPSERRSKTLFQPVPDEDLPLFFMKLKRTENDTETDIAKLCMPHWWLTAFRMGCFSRPENLSAEFCISFVDYEMTEAFYDALIGLGYSPCSVQICGSRICFSYKTPVTPSCGGFITRLVRRAAQWKNRFFCRLYRFVTRPFCNTLDRLIYLYFYLPICFRRCLRLRKYRKHKPDKCRKQKCCCAEKKNGKCRKQKSRCTEKKNGKCRGKKQ